MKKKSIIYLCFILFLFGCSGSLENKFLEQKLSRLSINEPFSLDTINKVDWDTLFIVKPYSFAEIEKYNFQMPENVKKDLDAGSFANDGLCALLFIKDHKLVNYAHIARTTVADFAFIDEENKGIAANTDFIILNSTRVVLVYENKFK